MAKEGEGGILEVERCPACKRILNKEIERDNKGGFFYNLICEKHGLMYHRHPTFSEAEEFNR